MTAAENTTVYVRAEDAEAFISRALQAHGVSAEHAAIVGECLTQADLRGVGTHGVSRLAGYIDRLEGGMINAKANPKVEQKTLAAAAVDGDDGFGFVVARMAVDAGVKMASEYGIGIVAARNSNHYGMAATHLMQAVDAGFIAFAFTNAPPAMPAWGSRQPMFGTNPFSVAAPSGTEVPFVLDMSPAIATRGKIMQAKKRGESIPEGYALDAEGRSTTDPAAAMDGVVLPIGGPKGSGITMLVDIMSGIYAGAAYATGVRDQFKDWDAPQNIGHFFIIMKPGLFISDEEFRARMDDLARQVHNAPRAEGYDEVFMPGEIEARREADGRRVGIAFQSADVDGFNAIADKAGVEKIAVSPTPFA